MQWIVRSAPWVVRYPIEHAMGSAFGSQRTFIGRMFGMDQLRGFCETFASRTDDRTKEQCHFQEGSLNCTQSPGTRHGSLDNSDDHLKPVPTISKPEVKHCGNRVKWKGRLLRAKKSLKKADVGSILRQKLTEEARLDFMFRQKLSEQGYTAKELDALKWTANTFDIERQPEIDMLESPWTEREREILKNMLGNRTHARLIAERLRRNEASVRAKIAEYFLERNTASLHEDIQALSPKEEELIFQSRLLTIWEGLMTFPKTQEWDKTLSNSPSDFWLALIAEHTPKRFKSVLASHHPPTVARLESLEWSDTDAAGVYGWVLKPKRKPFCLENECYLYVGSASKANGGLSGRRLNLLSSWPSTRNDTPKPDIRDFGLCPTGKLVTLFEVPFKDDSKEEVRRIRTLVTLARDIFMIWLAAFKEPSTPAIRGLVPWGGKAISYHGLVGHTPLARNIKM